MLTTASDCGPVGLTRCNALQYITCVCVGGVLRRRARMPHSQFIGRAPFMVQDVRSRCFLLSGESTSQQKHSKQVSYNVGTCDGRAKTLKNFVCSYGPHRNTSHYMPTNSLISDRPRWFCKSSRIRWTTDTKTLEEGQDLRRSLTPALNQIPYMRTRSR